MRTVHILFVDDEAHIRKVVATFLERRGYRVTTANDGQAALQILPTGLPDLIITDLNMPHVNGVELMQVLRANPLTAHIPIIILSAHAKSTLQYEEQQVSPDLYIRKPVELASLAGHIEALLIPVK